MKKCPRCGHSVRQVSKTLICQCGWTYSNTKEAGQKTIILGMFLTALAFAGFLFHFFQWGTHGFSVLFSDSSKKIEICMDLQKYDCVEKNYTKLFQTTGELNVLENLGEFQFKRKKFSSAAKTYKSYFSKEGKSYKAAYYYAHSLVKVGDIESAISYFDSILRSKPNILMVAIVESYLEILVTNKRIDKAKEILSWFNKVNNKTDSTKNQIQIWRKKFNI